jgi:sporadic carbohydrate cluster 2OG-Fe(II) oxygenase
MLKNNTFDYFEKTGFMKINLDKKYLKDYSNLKKTIKKSFAKNFKNNSFEKFHLNISFDEINEIRMRIIEKINKDKKIKEKIYLSAKKIINQMVGPDIIVQKNINLAIQMPEDESRALFHKDTPLSSKHEVVVWLPLVDCKQSMCMTMIPKKYHNEADSLLKKTNEKIYEDFSKKYGVTIPLKFGQALIFNTNNFHYIPINKTQKTRWSLNLRFKNLFTPYGERNLLDYYQIINSSPISKLLNI